MGDSSGDVTQRLYVHWFPGDRTSAMEAHAGRILKSAIRSGSKGSSYHDAHSVSTSIALQVRKVAGKSPPRAGVAKWQTRGTQNPVGATSCRFKSDLRH